MERKTSSLSSVDAVNTPARTPARTELELLDQHKLFASVKAHQQNKFLPSGSSRMAKLFPSRVDFKHKYTEGRKPSGAGREIAIFPCRLALMASSAPASH